MQKQAQQRNKRNIVAQYFVNNVLYTVCKTQKQRKQITAQNKSSTHCGRTNIYGVSV